MKRYCTQNNGDCETCSLANYNKDCRNKIIKENRRTFRFSEEDNEKLTEIVKHYFGENAQNMDTATLKMLIEKEHKSLRELNK